MTQPNLEDYITVAERIEKFYEKYPDGALQTDVVFDDGSRVQIKAMAFRGPDDEHPGVGHAEEIRGKGPVNRASAVENCETSAWGRAIAALGFEVKKGREIATREEMERAQYAETQQLPGIETVTAEQAAMLRDHFDLVVPPESSNGARDQFMRDFKLKLGTMGVSSRGVNAALASLTPAQAADLDAHR